MSLNWRNNRNFNYLSPKFSYFDQIYTDSMFCERFYQNFDKIPPDLYQLYTSKIEPIKAGFSTNDRLGFTGAQPILLEDLMQFVGGYLYNLCCGELVVYAIGRCACQ